MGNFYPPPPPSQGPSSSTLPLPHDPIPKQGDPPPRAQMGVVLAMAAVLSSWPADLEPRLQTPNNTQQKIAPLTLTYGSQPTPSSLVSATILNQIVTSWPPDSGPLVPRPNDRQQQIAPLTLTYGDQPRPTAFYSTTELSQIVASWPSDSGPLLPLPDWTQVKNAAVIPPPPMYQQAPPAGLLYPAIAQANADTYDVELVPTGVLGQSVTDQPPLKGPLDATTRAIIGIPWVEQWGVTPRVLVAPLTQTFGTVVTTGVPAKLYAQIVGAWPVDVGPQVPWPLNAPVRIAPLTKPLVTPPIPTAFYSATELNQIVTTWIQDWPAQSAPKNARWIPTLVSLPYTPLPKLIWTAWEQGPPLPERRRILTAAGNVPLPGAAAITLDFTWNAEAQTGATYNAEDTTGQTWNAEPTTKPTWTS